MNATMFVLMLYMSAHSMNHTTTPIQGFHTMEACQAAASQFTKQNWPRVSAAICYELPTGARS